MASHTPVQQTTMVVLELWPMRIAKLAVSKKIHLSLADDTQCIH